VAAWIVNSGEDALRLVDVGVDGFASIILVELVELRKEFQLFK
jgi:hypothetical protein